MANKPSVHVEPRESGWAVVREGSERATSVHPTQAEAAKEGRDIARREETEFFLHARDGRIREHNSYGEEPPPAKEEAAGQTAGLLDAVTETVGEVTNRASAAVGALGDAGGATRGAAGGSPAREGGRSGRATQAAARGSETTSEEPDDTMETRDLPGEQSDDRSAMPEEQYAGYEVYAQDGERIGKLDDLFIDENDNPEYVGVRMGLWGSTRSVLIPADVVTVEDGPRRMVVSRPKGTVEAGPTYGAHDEVTPELEERVRSYYGLASGRGAADKGGYGAYYRGEERADSGREDSVAAGSAPASAETGEVRAHDWESPLEVDRDQEYQDELRVRRSEEELKVGTREREAGAVRVRKRVRTDHERVVVPKKRVEVTVERAPVEQEDVSTDREATGPEIGEDEIVVPVIEEEIVVEKRPVIKEEIRIRKEVVEDTEVVEEDVRREEVDVDDQTTRRDS
jgi:uncharacterized protein (TIGR02271 family)